MKLLDLLLESRIDYLRNWFLKNPEIIRLYKIWHDDKHLEERITKDFDYFASYDPSQNKKYVQTILRFYLQLFSSNFIKDYFDFQGIRGVFFEDLPKLKEYLEVYDKVKQKLPIEQRDINKLSFNQLKDIALEYKEKEEEVLTKNDYLDKKYKINETDKYLVYMFKASTEKDFKMYQLVSTNTEWCTRPDYETFKNYINRSPLFIFINKSNRNLKYQFHEEDNQFMDAKDKKINSELIIKLISLIKNYLSEDFRTSIQLPSGEYGLINKNCKLITNQSFVKIGGFEDGIAAVIIDPNKNEGYINEKGEIIVQGFKQAYYFSFGYGAVQLHNNSFGYVNKKGKLIVKGFQSTFAFDDDEFGDGQITTLVKINGPAHSNQNGWIYMDDKLNFFDFVAKKKIYIPITDPMLKGIEIFPENLNK